VLATGGGAFMHPQSREAIRAKGISIWLRADYDVLIKRIKRRNDRPMLKTDDPGETLRRLMQERDPVYAEADVIVHSRDVPHEIIIGEIISAIAPRLAALGAVSTGARVS
jgi:shikimate kinase